MRLEVKTPPSVEPVTLDTAKAFLKVDFTTDDALITSMITTARSLIEEATGRAFINRTLIGRLDRWPGACEDQWWDGVRDGPISLITGSGSIELPVGPIQGSPAPIVRTYANDDTQATVDASTYFLATRGYGQAVLQLRIGAVWPQIVLRPANGIEMEFVAGYGTNASDCPSAVTLAILNLAAHLYERRGDVTADALPANVRALLAPYMPVRIG